MLKKLLALFVLPFLLEAAAYAQIKINFEEYDLSNGLHVILHSDESAPVVAVSVVYHVGSRNEKSNQKDFAHFFEHLMYTGTKDIAPGEYFKLVQNAGGLLNSNTSQDRTLYYEVLPSNQLALGLWIESERMQYLKIDSQTVETQVNIIKQERRQRYEDQPYGNVLEEIFKRAYKVYPYKLLPIGSTEDIEKAGVPGLEKFYKTFYAPGNATLSVSGDIDPDQTKNLVKEYFGGIAPGTNKIYVPDAVEPPQTKEIRDTVYSNIQLPAVVQAYHIPALGSKDFYAMDMLTTLLSRGKSSRLYRALVEQQQKAVDVEAYSFGMEAPGLFITLGIAKSGVNPSDLESAMNAEIENIKKQLISKEELQKLRNQIEARTVDADATNAGIAENLAEFHVLYGNTNIINTNLQRYFAVTREDIKDAANKYLQVNNRVVLDYLPVSKSSAGVK